MAQQYDTVTRKGTKISIIIVTLNAGQTLQACLNSVFEQEHPDIELIVIDGQSTDNTLDIIKSNAPHIHYWVSERDNGIYDAMNKAIRHTTGNWIYYLGADDVLLSDFSKLAAELKDSNAIYYSRVICSGIPTFPVSAYAFVKIGICHQAMIYPRAVFDSRRFNERYPISADFAFNMALFNSKAYHFCFKDYLIAKFNDTGVSSTHTDKVFEKDRLKLVFRHFGAVTGFRYVFWRLKKALRKSQAKGFA